MGIPSRRRFLQTVGAASATLLSGCTFEETVFGENVPGGHLFVWNQRDGEERVELSVTDRTNGDDRIVDAIYRIPAAHVLQFEEVLESGNTYGIRAFQPDIAGVGDEELSVPVETCEEGDASDKLDVAILVSPNGPDFVIYDCDRVYSRNPNLEYVDPSEYRTQTASETISTATPGS